MPLKHFLYRCPLCGRDPVEGQGDRVRCDGCGTVFSRGRDRPSRIRIRKKDGEEREVPPGELAREIDARGGPMSRARRDDGSVDYRTEVELRLGEGEKPVRYRGEVVGFTERLGAPEPGVLRVTDEALVFLQDGQPSRQWNLLDLGAIQTSSSTLQISPRGEEVVQFRFLLDSPRRWEDLLRELVAEAFRAEGRGEIVEYQPRIVAE